MCLGGGETDKFSAAKCEGCSDEDGTEALKPIVESAWVVPVFSTNITSPGSSAINDEYYSKNADVLSQISVNRERGVSYMYPMTAITLMVEKTNSASP